MLRARYKISRLRIKMHEAIPNTTWKKIILVMLITASVLITISYYDYAKILKYQVLLNTNITRINVSVEINAVTEDTTHAAVATSEIPKTSEDKNYLISSSKCKIVNLDVFTSDAKKYFKPLKYKSCTKNELLTYVTKRDNIATVHVNPEIIPQYTNNTLSCCYSDVSRSDSPKNPDDSIKTSQCKDFQNNTTITQDAIVIRCTDKGKKVYENVHTSVRINSNVQKKMNFYDNSINNSNNNSNNKPVNVLFIGIDSISRLNFIRALPLTYKYVEDQGWISLKGYNKMDDNTFPNLMAIFTGFNQTTAYKVCKPKDSGFLDKCPMLWYKYRDLGYITGYAEDAASISTFNYVKKGFIKPPTDYYFRPYVMATEKLDKVSVSSMAFCTGPETSGERILNLIRDFGDTFKGYPHFGFFWMNTFSHNEISTPTMMDQKIKNFLIDLDKKGVTNNTLIIFLSDHGIRFGDIRTTETGWLEERLPFIYFGFPPWFKKRFPTQYQNFQLNVNRLTTPYDLHMTLQHILTMSGLNHTTTPSDACPKCVSLFEEVPKDRSCEEAAISQHWCTCAGYTKIKLESKAEKKVTQFFLDTISKIIQKYVHLGSDKCSKYTVNDVSISVSQKMSYEKTSFLLVIMKTYPKAIFETTISYVDDIMNSTLKMGDVSRLDYYGTHSYCVTDAYVKKYCYCR
ncbi:uncharacterized protein [Euwallacea similis]|uniref:uncharacterized protein isoform X1 n=2 Tax=Euwallacea similis TaxID=1736056 RepID=UPI00344EB77F